LPQSRVALSAGEHRISRLACRIDLTFVPFYSYYANAGQSSQPDKRAGFAQRRMDSEALCGFLDRRIRVFVELEL